MLPQYDHIVKHAGAKLPRWGEGSAGAKIFAPLEIVVAQGFRAKKGVPWGTGQAGQGRIKGLTLRYDGLLK